MARIRPAHIEDLDVLHRIIRDATRRMDEQEIPQWDEIYPSKLVLKDDVEKQQMHIIEIDGRVAGLIVINEDQSPEYADVPWKYPGRVLVIHRLTIDPTSQRRGLAMRLMDFAEEMASAESYDCIRLDAFTRNPAALRLYENRGYRKAGIVRLRKGEFFCYEKTISARGTEKDSNKEFKSYFCSGRR
jgi:ribosomal protein S18 acetylase RimI-like enzyme